ncbi:MAG: SDR family oxidoreductase [Syntrophaceae bacterium]|nr:SDR family oxidoreductase [Syntrophaceae bacterium]
MWGIWNFKNKIAIVTGAGSGIGRELALRLAAKGSKVIITDIIRERIDQVVSELEARGVEAAGYRVDHSRIEDVQKFAQDFFSRWGHIDILCCNAGIGVGSNFKELQIKDWEWVMGINLWGAIYMLHNFVPKMIDRKSGSILITASGAGIIGIPGMAPYCTSKFAMIGLAESLRGELYKHNIKVSVLCPGVINTNIIKDGKILFADKSGKTAQSMVEKFYRVFGVSPAIVARQGISALRRDTGIKVSPGFQMWPTYVLKRLSPMVYQALCRFFFKYIMFRDSQ